MLPSAALIPPYLKMMRLNHEERQDANLKVEIDKLLLKI
jgi:hypothetical protein